MKIEQWIQGLKTTVSEMKNCLDELVSMLESVIVGEIEIIQTKFLGKKAGKKWTKPQILRYWGGKICKKHWLKYPKPDEKPLIHISKKLANLKIKDKICANILHKLFRTKDWDKKISILEKKHVTYCEI